MRFSYHSIMLMIMLRFFHEYIARLVFGNRYNSHRKNQYLGPFPPQMEVGLY